MDDKEGSRGSKRCLATGQSFGGKPSSSHSKLKHAVSIRQVLQSRNRITCKIDLSPSTTFGMQSVV